MNEVRRWAPIMKVFKFHGMKASTRGADLNVPHSCLRQDERLDMVANVMHPTNFQYDVVVTSYEMCIKEKASIQKFKWRSGADRRPITGNEVVSALCL